MYGYYYYIKEYSLTKMTRIHSPPEMEYSPRREIMKKLFAFALTTIMFLWFLGTPVIADDWESKPIWKASDNPNGGGKNGINPPKFDLSIKFTLPGCLLILWDFITTNNEPTQRTPPKWYEDESENDPGWEPPCGDYWWYEPNH